MNIRDLVYVSMRTKRQRKWYSALGMMLWMSCCALAILENHHIIAGRFWSTTFFVATLIWMVSVFAYMARDLWENRP